MITYNIPNRKAPNHVKEWQASHIASSLIDLNLLSLTEEAIAEYYFSNLPSTARRNDGRISTGYLKLYANPLKGGWGIEGYNPTNFEEELELRSFKPDLPRIDSDGKPIKYDAPKNSKHYPILPRVSYCIASEIARNAGLNILEIGNKYQENLSPNCLNSEQECKWFWQMVLDSPAIPLTVTEGAKKQLSLLSQGRCTIAVTSIYTWRSSKGQKDVHPWLALFARKRHLYLAFDQDPKKVTQKAVNGQSLKLGNALIKAGATKVKRITWSGTAKGIDDFIAKLSQKYGESYATKILRQCYLTARNYKSFGLNPLPGKHHKVNKQYLSSDDLKDGQDCKILVVKSAKGTGKTLLAESLVANDLYMGIPTINLSHLERLARELGQRLGLPYRTEKNTKSLRCAFGYSLCIDSFHPYNTVPFHPEQWQDAGLVMDEFTQLLQHLAFGTTEIRKYRKKVLATLGQKLADCWANNRQIRLLDADANAESIEFIYELIQLYSDEPIDREELENGTFTLINDYKQPLGNLYVDSGKTPMGLRLILKERMKRQENLLILSSGQKSSSGEGTIHLEELAQNYYKPEEILRIDSQTVNNPNHPAFGLTGEKLTKLIKKEDNQPQAENQPPEQLNIFESGKKANLADTHQEVSQIKLVIASPTICTGISIDNLRGYFSAVFSFQSGNITPNSVRQQLMRLRDWDCPRYIWCPKYGTAYIGTKSTNPIELITTEKEQGKSTLGLLGFKEAEKIIESNCSPLLKYWSVVGSHQNRDNYGYRDVLLEGLEDEGWNVKHLKEEFKPEILASEAEQRSYIKRDLEQKEYNFIARVPDIDKNVARKLEGRRELNNIQSAMLQKHNIKEKYGTATVKPELVEADQKSLYPKLRLRFWLGLGREFVEQNDRRELEEMKNQNGGKFFIPDLNRRTNIAKVKVLELKQLNLQRFTAKDTEWSNKSPELVELKDFVNKHLERINLVLKAGISKKDSPITVLQKLLAIQGKKLVKIRQIRDKNEPSGRLRIYGKCCSNFGLSEAEENAILDYWLMRERCKSEVIPLAS